MQLLETVSVVVFAVVLLVPLLSLAVDYTYVAGNVLAGVITIITGGLAFLLPWGSSLNSLLILTAALWLNLAFAYPLVSVDSSNLASLMGSWLLLMCAVAFLMRVKSVSSPEEQKTPPGGFKWTLDEQN